MPQVVESSFRNFVFAVALTLMIGWVLYVGRSIIVPFVVAAMIVYVVIGIANALRSLPVAGRLMPGWFRNLAAILLIAAALSLTVLMLITNTNQVIAVVPRYQDRLLGLIQGIAVSVGLDTEPTWTTLRDEVLKQIEFGPLIGSTVASVSQIAGVATVIFIYAAFLLVERTSIQAKLERLSSDPDTVAGMREMIGLVNERIGRYLALKTVVNVVLGLTSWAMMSLVGVEFAEFWAVLIALLNYIPYVGSFLGVMFPTALSALQFGDLGTVALVLVVLTAVQMFVGGVVEPYLLGSSLNLSPTVILLSLAGWTAVWGIPGAILSVPITASILIVLSSFESTRPLAVLLSRDGLVDVPPAIDMHSHGRPAETAAAVSDQIREPGG